MIRLSSSPKETNRIAEEFARTLVGGELILLEGELGAGKTAFVQGVAAELGVKSAVRSPTFAVMNVHSVDHPAIKHLVHCDFYRFKKPEEALELGLDEWLGNPHAVIFAEWPNLAKPFLVAKNIIEINFEALDANTRRVTFLAA